MAAHPPIWMLRQKRKTQKNLSSPLTSLSHPIFVRASANGVALPSKYIQNPTATTQPTYHPFSVATFASQVCISSLGSCQSVLNRGARVTLTKSRSDCITRPLRIFTIAATVSVNWPLLSSRPYSPAATMGSLLLRYAGMPPPQDLCTCYSLGPVLSSSTSTGLLPPLQMVPFQSGFL